MSEVLVTGANGFVGQHLAKELADHDNTVIGIGGPQGATETSPYITDYRVLDLTDEAAVKKLDFKNVTAVVHLAGLAAVGPSFDEPLKYITTNVGIEINLLEAALAQGARPRFLIVSSGSLYDPAAALPLSEASAVTPSSPYAVSKLGQEEMGRYYATRGIECIIARPFNHIGPGQNLGFIVPDLTKQAIDVERGKATEILVGNLDAQRDYTDVRDIARAYRLLLEKGVTNETYNICSGTAHSGHDILEVILDAAGVKAKITQDSAKMRPSDNPLLYGSHQKLTEHTGWQPEIDFKTTIADVVADWRTRD